MYDEERPYETLPGGTSPTERRGYWDMGSGLQAVDGLFTSDYAHQQAERYIAGDTSAQNLVRDVESHYENSGDNEQRQADVVATRITALLDASKATRFELTGRQLCIIHATLFHGVLPKPWVGAYRVEDISKREPILGGSSVAYSAAIEIAPSIDYDMREERARGKYDVHSGDGLAHFVSFVAGIWQTNPFREGNTRTTAVFSQLYLRSLDVKADNEPFMHNSLYYRDALVRASVPVPENRPYDHSFLAAFYNAVVNGTPFNPHVDMNVHGVRDDDTPYRSPDEYSEAG